MVCTTFFNGPQNQPTGDSEIDEMMADIRAVTGRNWQVDVREYSYRRFWQLKTTTVKEYDLLLEVGGFPNWQLIMSASGSRERLVAYLVGYMGSWADAKKLQPQAEKDNVWAFIKWVSEATPNSPTLITNIELLKAHQFWLKEKNGNQTLYHPASKPEFSLSNPELHLIRQWFGSVQDTNNEFLEFDDYMLAQKIYERLGLRVPDSIKPGKVADVKKNYPNPWATNKGFIDLGSFNLLGIVYDLYALNGLHDKPYTQFTLGARYGHKPEEYLSGQTISDYGKYDVLVASRVDGPLKGATCKLIKDHIKQPVYHDQHPNKLLFDAAGTPQY